MNRGLETAASGLDIFYPRNTAAPPLLPRECQLRDESESGTALLKSG